MADDSEGMETGREVVGAPVAFDSVTIVPVARSARHCRGDGHGLICFGSIVPVTVIVVSDGKKRAFRATGEEIPVEEVLMNVDGVKEVLDGIMT